VPEGLSLVYKFIHNISMLKTVADPGEMSLALHYREFHRASREHRVFYFFILSVDPRGIGSAPEK
jgi:hypothetical protein